MSENVRRANSSVNQPVHQPVKTRSKPDDVPISKQPKSRTPAGFREKILKATLPHYSGPYNVGMMDIEVPVREPRTFSHIKRNNRHLLELETVLFSVFYPSGFGTGAGESPEGNKKWSRATWLPRPRVELAKGYGKFSRIPGLPMITFFGATTMFTKLPAFRNATLATHWPPEQNSREGGFGVKNKAGSPPSGEPEEPCFPLLIFSHGLGGTRTTYSSVCGEFASYGFIVVSIEHRDGSGPRTFINVPDDGKISPEEGDTECINKGVKRPFARKDYVFPKNNAMDTAPRNKQGVDVELRSAQIQLRLAEIEEAYHVMALICKGEGEFVSRENLRVKGNIGSSSRGLTGVDWASWKDRFHLQQVTMLGHSFGAATTVEVLRHHDRFQFIGQGIIYDIWGAAIPRPDDSSHRINTPLLGINSEAFMYWPDNLDAVMSLCKEAKEHDALCWLMTVRGSVHISQSDFSLLYPHIASVVLKMTVNPRRALDLNINASLEFLKEVMPDRISAMNRGTNEHLLEVSTLDKLPEEHRPNGKWLAVRLRIPHELKLRLTPQWVRHAARKKKEEEAQAELPKLPKDPSGKPIAGLLDLAIGEEIWMHVAPTKEELQKHGLKPRKELQNNQEDGMVDHDGKEGQGQALGKHGHKGIEQKYMERG